MNPLSMMAGGGLSTSSSSSATGGTQGGTSSSFSPNFYSPFAVGSGASATATGPTGGDNTMMLVIGAVALLGGLGLAMALSRR